MITKSFAAIITVLLIAGLSVACPPQMYGYASYGYPAPSYYAAPSCPQAPPQTPCGGEAQGYASYAPSYAPSFAYGVSYSEGYANYAPRFFNAGYAPRFFAPRFYGYGARFFNNVGYGRGAAFFGHQRFFSRSPRFFGGGGISVRAPRVRVRVR